MPRTALPLAAAALVMSATVAFAQGRPHLQPVTWTFALAPDSTGQPALTAHAEVEEGWYVYSQFLAEGGPIPTSLDLTLTEGLELRGEPTEAGGEAIRGHDALFDMEIVRYKHAMTITQPLTLADGSEAVVGVLEFMTCNGKVCLPPEEIDIALAVPRG